MIDRCLAQQGQYTDLQDFDEDSEDDDEPPVVQKRARQKNKPKKLRAGTRRVTKNRGYYSSSDAEDDNDSLGSPPKSSRFSHQPPAPTPSAWLDPTMTPIPPTAPPHLSSKIFSPVPRTSSLKELLGQRRNSHQDCWRLIQDCRG